LRRKKAEPETPHFLSLSQDIVARSQEEKCELKYDICCLKTKKATKKIIPGARMKFAMIVLFGLSYELDVIGRDNDSSKIIVWVFQRGRDGDKNQES